MIIPTKHDGFTFDMARRVFDSGPSQPASQTQVSDLPDWARPYAQEVLGKTQALSETPYQTYSGERQAAATPLQQQSYAGASALSPSAAGQQGVGIAGLAANRALGTGYDTFQPGQFTGDTAAGYMSPYIQNVVNTQLREADRAAGIAGTQQQAQATQAGAFGGSRDAIMRAERERNLAQLKDDIVAKGYQQAFDTGRSQFNTEQQLGEQSRQFGAGLGLQGLQTALTGANTLGQIGNQQFGQAAEAAQMQNAMGTQQQQQQQNTLDQQYADFQAQQRYPYQQLEFFSNAVRGTPMGTVNTLYTPQPSALSQVAGLGAAGYGLSKMLAKGGRVKKAARPRRRAGLADLMVSKIT